MFTSGLSEGKADCKQDITIYDVSSDALNSILNYIYHAQIEITNSNVQVNYMCYPTISSIIIAHMSL